MVHAMPGDPVDRSLLRGAHRKGDQCSLEPLRRLETAVGQQSVIANRDRHLTEQNNANHKGNHAGPGKEPGQQSEQRDQMQRYKENRVIPTEGTDGRLR